MAVSISSDVADILARSTVDGVVVRLPEGQLDRSLYASTDRVLKALGGKWDRRVGGHTFASDPVAKLAAALGGERIVTRQQALQLFETPAALAARLCSLVDVGWNDTCLEPSAGRGRIVMALAEHAPNEIIAVELDPDNAAVLQDNGHQERLIVGDFLAQDPSAVEATVVVMNPPFSRNQDIHHVRYAFKCLKPGGRLAAIVSEHGFLGQERECVEWREWLVSLDAHVEHVPAGAFKASGTSVATRIVVLRKAVLS